MHYFLAFQILCGFFSAYVAGRKGRSRVRWWFIGALLPVLGVVWCLLPAESPESSVAERGHATTRRPPDRPKRCCGEFIPDCLGCPFFRRQLFRADASEHIRGHCDHFGKDLVDQSRHTTAR